MTMASEWKVSHKDMYMLLGEDGIKSLSTAFYKRVYADDEEPWFRFMFESRGDLDLAIHGQVTFFVQQFGGPGMYGGFQKDEEFMYHVHTLFKVTPRSMDRWMFHMDYALEEAISDEKYVGGRAQQMRSVLRAYFLEFGEKTINTQDDDPEAPHRTYAEDKRKEDERREKRAARKKRKKEKKKEKAAKEEAKEKAAKEKATKEKATKEGGGNEAAHDRKNAKKNSHKKKSSALT